MGKKENRLLEKSTKSCIVDNRKFLEDIRMNKIKRYLGGLAFLALAVIFSGIQAKAMKLSDRGRHPGEGYETVGGVGSSDGCSVRSHFVSEKYGQAGVSSQYY